MRNSDIHLVFDQYVGKTIFQAKTMNMTVVIEQTTEACDWKLIGFI